MEAAGLSEARRDALPVAAPFDAGWARFGWPVAFLSSHARAVAVRHTLQPNVRATRR